MLDVFETPSQADSLTMYSSKGAFPSSKRPAKTTMLNPGDIYTVSISAPGVRSLRDNGPVRFNVTVTDALNGCEWVVQHRYSDFDRLYEALSKRYIISSVSLPPKEPNPGKNPTRLRSRADKLEEWSSDILRKNAAIGDDRVIAFFGLDPRKGARASRTKNLGMVEGTLVTMQAYGRSNPAMWGVLGLFVLGTLYLTSSEEEPSRSKSNQSAGGEGAMYGLIGLALLFALYTMAGGRRSGGGSTLGIIGLFILGGLYFLTSDDSSSRGRNKYGQNRPGEFSMMNNDPRNMMHVGRNDKTAWGVFGMLILGSIYAMSSWSSRRSNGSTWGVLSILLTVALYSTDDEEWYYYNERYSNARYSPSYRTDDKSTYAMLGMLVLGGLYLLTDTKGRRADDRYRYGPYRTNVYSNDGSTWGVLGLLLLGALCTMPNSHNYRWNDRHAWGRDYGPHRSFESTWGVIGFPLMGALYFMSDSGPRRSNEISAMIGTILLGIMYTMPMFMLPDETSRYYYDRHRYNGPYCSNDRYAGPLCENDPLTYAMLGLFFVGALYMMPEPRRTNDDRNVGMLSLLLVGALYAIYTMPDSEPFRFNNNNGRNSGYRTSESTWGMLGLFLLGALYAMPDRYSESYRSLDRGLARYSESYRMNYRDIGPNPYRTNNRGTLGMVGLLILGAALWQMPEPPHYNDRYKTWGHDYGPHRSLDRLAWGMIGLLLLGSLYTMPNSGPHRSSPSAYGLIAAATLGLYMVPGALAGALGLVGLVLLYSSAAHIPRSRRNLDYGTRVHDRQSETIWGVITLLLLAVYMMPIELAPRGHFSMGNQGGNPFNMTHTGARPQQTYRRGGYQGGFAGGYGGQIYRPRGYVGGMGGMGGYTSRPTSYRASPPAPSPMFSSSSSNNRNRPGGKPTIFGLALPEHNNNNNNHHHNHRDHRDHRNRYNLHDHGVAKQEKSSSSSWFSRKRQPEPKQDTGKKIAFFTGLAWIVFGLLMPSPAPIAAVNTGRIAQIVGVLGGARQLGLHKILFGGGPVNRGIGFASTAGSGYRTARNVNRVRSSYRTARNVRALGEIGLAGL